MLKSGKIQKTFRGRTRCRAIGPFRSNPLCAQWNDYAPSNSPLGCHPYTISDVTRLPSAIKAGDPLARELLPLVYEELRRMAAAKMARENPGLTLQPIALVHEAWRRLGGEGQPTWENRAHFFGASAEAMRRILVERARRRLRQRHGGGQERVNINGLE